MASRGAARLAWAGTALGLSAAVGLVSATEAVAALRPGPAASVAARTASPAPQPTTPTSPAAAPSPDPGTGGGADAPRDLSPEEVAAQIRTAKALRARLARADADLAAAMRRLHELADTANVLLQRLARAEDVQRRAVAEADASRRRTRTIEAQLDAAREQMRRWAFSVYTEGGDYAEALGVLESLGADPDRAANPLGDLGYVTDERLRSVQRIRELTAEQRTTTARAEKAERSAKSAARDALAARRTASRATAEQRAVLAGIRADKAATVAKAGPLAASLFGLSSPDAATASSALRDALVEAGIDVTDVDAAAAAAAAAVAAGTPEGAATPALKGLGLTPCSDRTDDYPNGRVPPSALCPLLGSRDEFLRPGPAAAFNAMSAAYARSTGHLICVVDGYRSYPEQVALKAEKGKWAATPGRSQHGYGRAVDLCGGVEDFGNKAHLWLEQNAALYGWYHPAWAAANGSLPEPWHWQYAG